MSDFWNSTYRFVNYQKAFVLLSTVVNVFFLLYFFGFLKDQNELVESISFYLRIFIGLFLVLKFNPFYFIPTDRRKFTEFDRRVVFSAGVYVLIINGIGTYNDYIFKKNISVVKTKQPSLLEKED